MHRVHRNQLHASESATYCISISTAPVLTSGQPSPSPGRGGHEHEQGNGRGRRQRPNKSLRLGAPRVSTQNIHVDDEPLTPDPRVSGGREVGAAYCHLSMTATLIPRCLDGDWEKEVCFSAC